MFIVDLLRGEVVECENQCLRRRPAVFGFSCREGAVRTVGARHGRFARCGRALPPATERQVRHAVRAIRWASHVLPTRWVCLEQSTAAAVLLAAAGRRAEWRHGVATDPVRLHAWIADHTGAPVEEPADTAL
ncbi:MAG: lasso peptide biosynthesis B2 protein, partial [Pseudonocardiaceae bacterium]